MILKKKNFEIKIDLEKIQKNSFFENLEIFFKVFLKRYI